MRFIITSGSTFARWDRVRGITNVSKGTTGAKIAEEALLKGFKVDYIANENTKQPFEIKINPHNISDLEFVRKGKDFYHNYTYHKTPTFDDYLNNCLTIPNTDERTVFIATAAVSDYAPIKANGKISSSDDKMKLDLVKLPKVIKEVKSKYPMMPIVGFKLLSSENSTLSELIEVAYKSLLDLKLALVVANLVDKNFKPIKTVIITPEKNIIPVLDRNNLASVLIKTVEQRINHDFYKTKVVNKLPDDLQIKPFFQLIKNCTNYSLFSPYGDGRKGADFGSVAVRTDKGMLTTGRGTTKENVSEQNIALITDIKNNTISISSNNVKGTLNAPTLWHILKERKEINFIVHAHVYLPNGCYVDEQSSPGTFNDYAAIKSSVEKGMRVINQVGHGCLILLEKHEDLLSVLLNNGLYNSPYSKYYDAAYYRFEKGSLEHSIESLNLNKDINVLDLACGTGKSTLELVKLGFTNINIADGSKDMLKIAEERLNKIGTVATFENLNSIVNKYDLITIRQAFPYLDRSYLDKFSENIYSKLNKNGYLIFNSFKPLAKNIQTRYDEFENAGVLLKTKETNIISEDQILHSQRTEYLNSNTGEYIPLYDINIFNQYDFEKIKPIFEKHGFKVDIKNTSKSQCFIARKK